MNNQKLKRHIESKINESGFIVLNFNNKLPSLVGLGGDWNLAMSLIEERKVFLSKLYKKRTTYLSRQLYFTLKKYKQNIRLSHNEQAIFDFLEDGPADTETIKSMLLLDKKAFDLAMTTLLENLYVTVLNRGKTLTDQWSSYIWGTFLDWEKHAGVKEDELTSDEVIALLNKNLSINQIKKMLNIKVIS